MLKLLPNFTPIPNIILREWMKNLSGSEFKVLLTIADQTYGWIEDQETGRRKKEDWIAYSQFENKTGLQKQAITHALRRLEELKYIEIVNMGGKSIDIKMRQGKRLFYRINTNMDENQPSELYQTINMGENQSLKITHTKETNTKDSSNRTIKENSFISEGMRLLKQLNPTFTREGMNRKALWWLRGRQSRILNAFKYAKENQENEFCPQIVDFVDLHYKWSKLEAFARRNKKTDGLYNSNGELQISKTMTGLIQR